MTTTTRIDRRRLRQALAAADMPLWRLAQTLGYPPSTLSDWTRGVHEAPPDLAQRMERALGLPPGSLTVADDAADPAA